MEQKPRDGLWRKNALHLSFSRESGNLRGFQQRRKVFEHTCKTPKYDLKEDLVSCALASYEVDAVTVTIAGCLCLLEKADLIGNGQESYIIVPIKGDWRMRQ